MIRSIPLHVTLAGFNVDINTLNELITAVYEGAPPPARESITPETISAAYARISRNPAEVGELREISRHEVEKARRSNENIVFGLGHSSVAEHASFNMDVVGISRLGVEAVERHRLASFTEKSQRYIKLDGDIVIPPEIVEAGFEKEFLALIERQNSAYFKLHPKLTDYFIPRCEAKGEKNPERAAKAFASEDARYVVSLATQAQFGMTLNARTLEMMIRDALAHPLKEINLFGRQLRDAVHPIAPSLIKYIEATDFERDQFARMCHWDHQGISDIPPVRLLAHTPDGDVMVIAAMLVNQRNLDWDSATELIRSWSDEQRSGMVHSTLRNGRPWDPPPREFELADFTFELSLSAAAYGQLKRHRMSTQILGPYDPSLGWTVPDSVREADGEDLFNEVMEASAFLGRKIAARHPAAAPYALTNAHRRRVLFKANAREMYHVSRLREDLHAQWDIRRIAAEMVHQAKEVAPVLMTMAVGKHEFEKRRIEVYGETE
jgi:flavin-dependent thymidylate synthase